LSKEKPLAGVVLDLRSNSGGSLEEAVRLVGLFIKSGPVVGERDGRNHVAWQKDRDREIAFDGPLVILTNQFSASASEIVAGTLKAYGRAMIVGHTQTFGKGTVQQVLPLGPDHLPGDLKLTIAQYYLADGSSVQLKGVEPDVVIPGPKLLDEEGLLERATPSALPWDQIPGLLDKARPEVKLWTDWKTGNLALLQEKSKVRVAANQPLLDAFDPAKLKEAAAKAEDGAEPANPDAPPALDEKKDKDYQADEAAAIINDMIPTWPSLSKLVAK
jgi:hypothetical protein